MRSSGFLATRGVGVRNSGPCHERGQRILELFPSRAYPPAMGKTYDPQNVFARILRHELPCEQVFEDAHTQRVAAAVKRAFEVPGIMIVQINGAAAGQTVPHVHFHVIPRRPGETLRLHATVKADPAHLRASAERIRRCLTEN
jgi:hypothetical protein